MTQEAAPHAPAASAPSLYLSTEHDVSKELNASHDPVSKNRTSNTFSRSTPHRKPVPLPSQPSSNPQKPAQYPLQQQHHKPTKPWPWHHHHNRLSLSSLSRRTLAILATALLLLILTIGLAAGLTARHHSSQANLPLPSSHGGPYTGDLTYYAPGLGACGVTSADGDAIVSVSHLIFDAVAVGENPNLDPLCGKMVRVRMSPSDSGGGGGGGGSGGGSSSGSVDLKVVDRCVGCQARDLDVTESTFAKLADVALGRVRVQWSWLEGVPGAAGGGGGGNSTTG